MTDNSNSTTVTILETDLTVVRYKGEPVITFAMIDRVHKRPDGTAKRTFNENDTRFVEGEDFVDLTSDEIRTMSADGVFPPRTARGKLLTRRGYLKITKSLGDDRAWEVFAEMLDRYFAFERLPGAVDMACIEAVVRAILPGLLEAERRADSRHVVSDFVSVRELLDDAGAVQKGRNGINRRIGNALRELAALAPDPGLSHRCAHSGTWLFQRSFAAGYMRTHGRALVADHNAAAAGQGVLLFPVHRRGKPGGHGHASL